MFNSLLFDIARRNPISKIVFNGDFYYLLSNNIKYKIPENLIEELIEKGFVKKNSLNGLSVTDSAIEFSDTLIETKKTESKKHPGHFDNCSVVPEPLFGEIV